MKLSGVCEFLESLPYANISSDRNQIMVKCPFCGDSEKHNDSTHFSIKIEIEENEPMVYQCFQPTYKCGAKGILTADVLQRLGCTDISVLLEISKHNSRIYKKIDKFSVKKKKNFEIFNLNNEINSKKIKYINSRLGLNLNISDLKDIKIQLSLYDYLNINNIRELAFKEKYCDMLNSYCICFISMYEDYLICRDITKTNVMGRRYMNYHIIGKQTSIDDTKIYTIPTDIDLLSDKPTIINIAEGAFSILGAYYNTTIDRYNKNNKIFTANCGMGYYNTISHLCKQYGLTNVIINVFSDSEVPIKTYNKLLKSLSGHIKINEFKIIYNSKKEDFGHSKRDICPQIINLTNI